MMRQKLRRPAACLLLVWYLPACTSFQTTALAPADAVADQSMVRVTVVTDGDTTRWQVKEPWVRGDSLGGSACGSGRYGEVQCDPADRFAVPLSSVVELETRRGNAVRTTMLASVLVILAFGGALTTQYPRGAY